MGSAVWRGIRQFKARGEGGWGLDPKGGGGPQRGGGNVRLSEGKKTGGGEKRQKRNILCWVGATKGGQIFSGCLLWLASLTGEHGT